MLVVVLNVQEVLLVKVVVGLKIIKEKGFSAISVECFSMVMQDQVTACLPLAVLNRKNIVAACEGDICSMTGKMLIRSIAGEIPWQANVAEIKDENLSWKPELDKVTLGLESFVVAFPCDL